MYVRNLCKPSPVKNLFRFASTKSSELVMCKSSLEFDACFHLEYNEDVLTFQSQPEGFIYSFQGKELPYTPDMLITKHDSTLCFHEYKPFAKACSPLFREKFLAKKQAAKAQGIELFLVTDKQIRVNPILNNLKLLHRYCGIKGLNKLQRSLLSIIQASGMIKLARLTETSQVPRGQIKANVLALIAAGKVETNLVDQAFDNESLLWCE